MNGARPSSRAGPGAAVGRRPEARQHRTAWPERRRGRPAMTTRGDQDAAAGTRRPASREGTVTPTSLFLDDHVVGRTGPEVPGRRARPEAGGAGRVATGPARAAEQAQVRGSAAEARWVPGRGWGTGLRVGPGRGGDAVGAGCSGAGLRGQRGWPGLRGWRGGPGCSGTRHAGRGGPGVGGAQRRRGGGRAASGTGAGVARAAVGR